MEEKAFEDVSITREKGITRTSIIGILANVVLVIFKAIVGIVAGSVAIIMDAINNLTDAISSVVTIIGIKLAQKDADEEHPFGHGRIEYFSAVIIALIIFAAGVMALVESIQKIFEPEVATINAVSLIIVAAAIVVKIFLSIYFKKQGEKYYSDALLGSGKDALFDVILTSATLVGAVVTLIFHISIDGYVGVIISAFILKAGFDMLKEPLNQMVGLRPDGALTKNIKADIKAMPGVIGAYDLVLHNYGPDSAIGSVHVEIEDTLTARDIHILSVDIQKAIKKKYNIFLTVGIYAVNTAEYACNKQAHVKEDMLSHDGVKGCHGIYIDDEKKYISFDILVNFKVKDKPALREILIKDVEEDYPGYEVEINFDIDYTD